MEIGHMKFIHKLIALVATGMVVSGAAMAQNPTRLQLQDAEGDRGILTVAPITSGQTRTYTFPNASGTMLVTSGTVSASSILRTNSDGEIETVSLNDGQLLIGSTGTPPQAGTLSVTRGLTVANGAGTITLGMPTASVTGTLLRYDGTDWVSIGNGLTTSSDGDLTLGSASSALGGSLVFHDDAGGSAFTGTITTAAFTGNRTYALPDESGTLVVGAAGSKTLAAGTANNNTVRWNSATSSWDETSKLTVGTDGAIQLLAGTDGTIVLSALGAATLTDSVGGHLRIRQTTGDANNSDVYLRALGTGDAIAELRLGYNGDDGDFRLYSKNAATEELALTTASSVLTMGSVNNAITIDASTAGDIVVGTASHYLQVDAYGSPFVKLASTDIQLDGPATVTGALTSNAVLYDIALTGGTSPYVVGTTDHVIIIEAGITEVDLPAGALGRSLIIKNQSGGNVDIDPDGTETINGGGAGVAMALADGAATHIVFSGGNWYVVGP